MTASLEEYLKTIYIISQKNEKVRITDIALELNYAKPSVNRAVKVLALDGYVNFENYGIVELTDKGIETAIYIIKKYGVLKEFLIQVLEIDEKNAEYEAKKMKHAISEDTAIKLESYIQSIIDVGDLTCSYNPNNKKCRNCIKLTAKNRMKLNK